MTTPGCLVVAADGSGRSRWRQWRLSGWGWLVCVCARLVGTGVIGRGRSGAVSTSLGSEPIALTLYDGQG